MEEIEYRVRPVTRYIVTRFHRVWSQHGDSAGSEERGEFDNFSTAYKVGYALAKQDHDRLGYPPGDKRIRYPDPDFPNETILA